MKRKFLLTILIAILLFSATSGLAFAESSGSLIKELSIADSFHLDMVGDYYNEWHYFNVIDEEQELSIITSFKLSGEIPTAEVLLGYDTGGTQNAAYDIGVPYLDGTDVIINGNKVVLTEKGYEVHVDATTVDSMNQIIFDAVFKPFTRPASPLSAELADANVLKSSMNWLVASPKMEVTGSFTIKEITSGKEITYDLKNVRGYHDHNWGYWDWANIGWDWGQVTQTKSSLNGNDLGTYTVSFGNVIDNTFTSTGSVLNVWKNMKIVEEFRNEDVEITHTLNLTDPFFRPSYTNINATSSQSSVNILFTPDYFIAIPIPYPFGTKLVIWEGFGTYVVEGNINGKEVSYEAKGFMEYAPNLP